MTDQDRKLNTAWYEKFGGELSVQFPHRQFVAFGRGAVIADSADFDELEAKLTAVGWDRRDVMVVRVGDEPRNHSTILTPFPQMAS